MDYRLFTGEDAVGWWSCGRALQERMEIRSIPARFCDRVYVAAPGTPWGEMARDVMRTLTMDTAPIIGIVGDRGTGKTQMCAYITYRAIRARVSSRYTTASDLLRNVREAMGFSGPSEREAIKRYTDPRVLMIDELQVRADSQFEDRTLTEIIDIRYGAMQPTVLLSNLSKSDFMNSLGPSIVSRMEERGGVMTCDWEGFRAAS